ncbi:2-C-methyl-D-erythritol 4-phosphate cytidylyltransferase [Haloferula luteola]|uniref:2-C-methyl-D-erythritol 4-phosphate cytidylyltransferase n=1 Tax=Haloferula luteola TaxID=595692 RepID=A0A840V9H6_9BACT|nr:2-C-methyl-D-erythritol 4-phosphate cytidylyltransferase [Haloferula luteola]MBB5350610.1 2-C-methyl-D-erythritol 4-phosphate cytidylyltransferase [Haloferula luteola]
MACDAIIVASGSSRRMGFDKLAAELAGISVLRRTVAAFLGCPDIQRVVVVCPQDRFDALLSDVADQVCRVDGGQERHFSVLAGLAEVSADQVAVHDGARPLITPSAIRACLTIAQETGAAALARPVTETLKRANEEGFSDGAVSRENLWNMETPQIFQTGLLRRAYAEVLSRNLLVTDEVSALEALGVPTKLCLSTAPNLKITHPADLHVAGALLRSDSSHAGHLP